MTERKLSAKQRGLSREEVIRSRKLHGENRLEEQKGKSFFRVFLSSFSDPIIRILVGAVLANLLISGKNADLAETLGILAAILIATLVSSVSEMGSEKAFEKLKESSKGQRCRVRREGALRSIPAEEVVVGDVVVLGAGEKIPADGILTEGSLRVDQSALNGESAEAAKRPLLREGEQGLFGENRLFRGSSVCSGEGVMTVQKVGGATLYGQIAKEVQQESPVSPMKLRLRKLAGTVSVLGYVAAALVAGVYLAGVFCTSSGHWMQGGFLWKTLLEALTLGITILVVAVPEGLPMMITVVLSSNMKRMLRDKVLVRKPVGIETAGSLNLLLTDKTGTLTQGKMSLTGMILADGSISDVEELKKRSLLWERLCLNAYYDTAASLGVKGEVLGSTATDRAVLEAVLPMDRCPEGKAAAKLPFCGENKYSAAWLADGTVFVKGAPERLLARLRSAYSAEGRILPLHGKEALLRSWKECSSRGVRVLLAAEGKGGVPGKELPGELTLLGLLLLSDPLRPEAKEAVATVRGAGVRVMMVTGDHPDTACAIARASSILRGEAGETVLTGERLEAMSDGELKRCLPRLRVVARAVPAHKSRLVRVAQEQGLVVGMTGDGINDAAALKQADVGFAMGSASEIAKEAGDIVITDDRFASIVKAVLYGRTLFKSIRKFVMFQFTMNLCAVGVSLLGPLMGIPRPVTVLQMLWVNLIMDTLGGIAFAGEAAMPSYLKEPPKRRDEPILNRSMARKILVAGLSTLSVCLWFLKSETVREFYGYYRDPAPFLTAFFVTFIFAGIVNCFVMRSARLRLLEGLAKNRAFLAVMLFIAVVQMLFVYFGGPLLRTVPLSPLQLGVSLLFSLAVAVVNLLAEGLFKLLGAKTDV